MWIGGVRFNSEVTVENPHTGAVTCSTDLGISSEAGVSPGFVCMPTYRTSVFSNLPFSDTVSKVHINYTDFFHIKSCAKEGYKVDWFESVIYLVRPELGGVNGRGND